MSYQKRFYLTGSINQPTVEDAFAFVGSRLQPGVTRVPDGEPGDRANWVLTQSRRSWTTRHSTTSTTRSRPTRCSQMVERAVG
jgi:hypothetical protein